MKNTITKSSSDGFLLLTPQSRLVSVICMLPLISKVVSVLASAPSLSVLVLLLTEVWLSGFHPACSAEWQK